MTLLEIIKIIILINKLINSLIKLWNVEEILYLILFKYRDNYLFNLS